ncbi:cobaltochelatase subunit CobN [Variovorax sp. PAMC 28711]|uniref:cobaltochelatase subunit CobN n=1 Tax=Variovorax sp. PAMC 28711 TaxID=1795631 RepID=UPI000AB6A767|nr:cobaltochelatase subunit CobN [Variovorax sp. PAMC 28711]
MKVLRATWAALCLLTLGFAAEAAEPPRVVLLSTYLVSPARLAKLQSAAQQAGVPLTTVSAERDAPDVLARAIEGASLLVIDTPHPSVAQNTAVRFGEAIGKSATPYVLVGEFSAVSRGQSSAAVPLAAERGVDAAWAQRLRAYWRFAGAANMAASMTALRRIGVLDGLPAPVQVPLAGFYHPGWPRIESDIAALDRLPSRGPGKTVAIAVNNAVFSSDDTGWLDQLIGTLEQRGLGAYAFYGPRQQKDLFFGMTHANTGAAPRRVADLVINAALVFNPTERKAELERIGVPVLQTMPALAMDAAQWAASKDGFAQSDVASYYTPSELAGMVDAMLITARDPVSGALQPIPSQIAAVAAKAASLLRLRQIAPAERRVAMLVYNYPAGEGNFGASFLNVPKSLHNMLAAMQTAGYRTEAPAADAITPQVQATMSAFYKPEMLAPLQTRGLADALPLRSYMAWFRALPPETQRRIESHWGAPEKSAMLRTVAGEPAFVIPRVAFGNVVVLPQPPRQEPGNDPSQKAKTIYHRSATPLSHSYLATYLWLRTQFGASAVVHVGTHGTLEWAPGKERGLATQDDPLLALGDLPNVYPYIMDNLGEAVTAKRRGRAVLVSHSTPMFSPAGFRPQVQEMHELMHDWENVSPGPVKVELEARLTAQFVEHQYHRDLKWTREQILADFSGFMELLHPFLDELAMTAQPLGLAAFGEVPDAERRRTTILQILRKPLIEALGEDIDEVFLLDAKNLAASRPARWLAAALTDARAASTLDLRAVDAAQPHMASAIPNRAEAKKLDSAALLALAERAQKLDAVLARNEEIEGFLSALDARHLASSYGGDPVRNPDSLPTGRNLYGFDPSRVPTREAWDTAVAALDAWVAEHRKTHGGKPPEKIAFTLWAGETMRHQGVMESQAFYAMGVKPRWDEAGRVVGVDTLPMDALKRPRMDVLVSVTGSYRDQFPTVMRWLDTAVRQVALLREQDNFVARNSDALAARMVAEGATPAQAQRWSTARVFSNAQGSYGSGLADAALASDTWKMQDKAGGDAQMAALYLDRMGHAQGDDVDGMGRHKAYAANLAQVDAALLSRTSNTYGMLTSDDPFQYLGGIALAVRELTGKSPALYVQNLRDGSEVRTDSADTAIAKEMQTRYLHPQWINAQKAEGYSGTLQVLKTAQFLWGWQVTAPQAVRQDHWQSLHEVYVRDKYQLGTREWLEGDNRAAFAQTLERMLDAVRLKYWEPDAATRRELVQAYNAAIQATGQRDGNAAVQRFAARQAGEATDAAAADGSAPRRNAWPVAPRPVEVAAAQPPMSAAAEAPAPDPDAPTPVRGLQLTPQPESPRVPAPTQSLIASLAALLGLALVLLAGAWRQSRRPAVRTIAGA